MKKKHAKKGRAHMNRLLEKVSQHVIIILSVFIGVLLIGIVFTNYSPKAQSVCANSISCIHNLSVQFDPNLQYGTFMGKRIPVPKEDLAFEPSNIPIPSVLGDNTYSGPKHVFVDLSKQTMYLYEGSTLVNSFLVSTGKWGPTPVGTFHFWIRLPVTCMSGGEGAAAYSLCNIHYTMFFYNDQVPKSAGYSTHEAWWHNNFGHTMSHGCVNMRLPDAKFLYYWIDPPVTSGVQYLPGESSTPITIYGVAPND